MLTTLVSFAMFGLLFAAPLYFQEVRGVDAMGSGLRLLPLIGGMVVGMIGSTRLASPRKTKTGTTPALASAKSLVAVGFTIMTVGLVIGATTSITSGTGFAVALDRHHPGLGLGMSMPQAMNCRARCAGSGRTTAAPAPR